MVLNALCPLCLSKVSYGRLLENHNAPFGERWSLVATKITVIRYVIWMSKNVYGHVHGVHEAN